MQINATLIGQAIGFLVLIWFTWKFVWPPLLAAMDERQKKIADGLAAADRGQKDLDEAKAQALEIVRGARNQAAQIVDQANRRGNELVDEARGTALAEGERLLASARGEIATETARARGELRSQVAHLALAGASQLLKREVDAKAHAQLLDELATRIAASR
ncbi:MAG: F0F1 ATP synthase subunit B [Proteobacteria bacterium]|nr:F0F1 ATP synthase subunit B [Pseudomonadota bacterium]